MIKPIKPKDVQTQKNNTIPDFVIEAVNELIVANWDGHRSLVWQKDVVSKAKKLQENEFRAKHKINQQHGYYIIPKFEIKWLDFEPLFEKNGWKVEYDKPGYCETYEPSFKFTKK